MKIYENSKINNGTSNSVTCNYCWDSGHNKRHCEHLKRDYLDNKSWDIGQGMESLQVDLSQRPNNYFHHGAKRQLANHFIYAKSLYEEEGKAKSPTTRKAPSCGFCGSKEHTRRKCNHMATFVKVLEDTNRAYREMFYNKVIVEMGIGLGAFIEYGYSSDSSLKGKNITGIITDFDPKTISIGNLLYQYGDYNTPIHLGIDSKVIKSSFIIGEDLPQYQQIKDSPLSDISAYYHWTSTIQKIIAPSPNKPDKEWFLGQSDAFDWVVKKKSIETLWGEYREVIKRFHPKVPSDTRCWWHCLDWLETLEKNEKSE